MKIKSLSKIRFSLMLGLAIFSFMFIVSAQQLKFKQNAVLELGSDLADLSSYDVNNKGIEDITFIRGDGSIGVYLTDMPEPYVDGSFNSNTLIKSKDFNGDGKIDYAAGSSKYTSYSPTEYPIVGSAYADFNGDGIKDVVVGSSNPYIFLKTYLGNSSGFDSGFSSVPSYNASTNLQIAKGIGSSVKVLNVNGDKFPDIMVNLFIGGIRVYVNNGDGTFTLKSAASGGYSYFRSMTSGDLNKDGLDDIVVGSRDNGAQVYLNNGNGLYTIHYKLLPSYVKGVSISDMDGDGNNDVLVVNAYWAGPVKIYYGDSSGYFNQPPQIISQTTIYDNYHIVSGDFNGDGYNDIIVGDRGFDGQNFIAKVYLQVPITTPTPTTNISKFGGKINAIGTNYIDVKNWKLGTRRVYITNKTRIVLRDGLTIGKLNLNQRVWVKSYTNTDMVTYTGIVVTRSRNKNMLNLTDVYPTPTTNISKFGGKINAIGTNYIDVKNWKLGTRRVYIPTNGKLVFKNGLSFGVVELNKRIWFKSFINTDGTFTSNIGTILN